MVEVDVAIVCACLPTFRPLFDRRVRRVNKSAQNVEMALNDSFASSNRKSGYDHVEEGRAGVATNGKFLDVVRKNWATIPSVRSSVEWRTSSQGKPNVRVKSADEAKFPSSIVREWHAENEHDGRNASGDTIIPKAYFRR